MGDIRQTIVVRKDLNMRKGKMCSQVSHASMLSLLSFMRKLYVKDNYGNESIILQTEYDKDSYLGKWLDGTFTKICLGCDSEEQLIELFNNAEKIGLPVVMVTDNGVTEFNGVKTKTCIAILAPKEDIDKITSSLTPL